MIPKSYTPCSWRCTLPVEPETGDIALAFNLKGSNGKEVVRIRLDKTSAKHLVETITGYYSADLADSRPPDVSVSFDFLRRVEFALVTLKLFIDQAPGNNPLLWIGDQKTPVTQIPTYHSAEAVLSEIAAYLGIKAISG